MRKVVAGETIFREGDVGDCAYLVESGRVLIFIQKGETEVPLRVLGEGEVFGEMSLIDDTPRSAPCRVLDDGQLIVVTKEQLMDRVQTADPVVKLLMQMMLDRLRSHNERLRGTKTDDSQQTHASPTQKKQAIERIGLEDRIATALENDEFVPYYQPIFDIERGTVVGCEALIRWNSRDKGIVSPGAFMDVMEDSRLILRAGQIMLEKSIADLPAMLETYGAEKDFFVSVNVSGRQFTDPTFLKHLDGCRARSGSEPHQIKLELTERIMTEGMEAVKTMKACRDHGYLLAIDDFGTGFSSLQYLAQMPLTDLKIDRSFVMKMLEDEKSLSIIRSLIHMAGLLGLKLIAEGVETNEQLAMLRGLNVSMGQGYLFSKPLPLAEFLGLAKRAKSA